MRICITFGGHTFCFYIPLLYWPWPPIHGPGPDPGPEKVERWLISQDIKAETARDLQGLATVYAVGQRLGGELGASISNFAQEKAKQTELPAGVGLEFGAAGR